MPPDSVILGGEINIPGTLIVRKHPHFRLPSHSECIIHEDNTRDTEEEKRGKTNKQKHLIRFLLHSFVSFFLLWRAPTVPQIVVASPTFIHPPKGSSTIRRRRRRHGISAKLSWDVVKDVCFVKATRRRIERYRDTCGGGNNSSSGSSPPRPQLAINDLSRGVEIAGEAAALF